MPSSAARISPVWYARCVMEGHSQQEPLLHAPNALSAGAVSRTTLRGTVCRVLGYHISLNLWLLSFNYARCPSSLKL